MNDHHRAPAPSSPPGHPSRFARHREMATAVVSFFVGALALATSTYNVYLQRQQVRAQVWPRVRVHTDYEGGVFSIGLVNQGVGPAEVKRVRVTVDGKRARDWFDAERMLLERDDYSRLNVSIEPVEAQVLGPGAELATFKVKGMRDARDMFFASNRLATEVCYCSSLGDCWMYSEPNSLEAGSSAPAHECKADPVPFQSATRETMERLRKEFAAALGTGPIDAGGP